MRLSGVAGCAAAESADMRRNLISYTLCPSRCHSCDRHSTRQGRRARVRRRAARRASPPPRARRFTSTAPRRSPRAIAPSTRRSPAIRTRIHYALKANSTLAITRLLRGLGSNADANSGGEIDVALRAGFIAAADRLHRRRQDAGRARAGHRSRHPHHQRRVRRRDRAHRRAVARARGTRARIAIRINPDVDAEDPPAHLDRPQDQQVRHRARPRCRRCARTRAARPASRSSACTRTSARRSPISEPLTRAGARAGHAGARAARRRHAHRAPRSRRRARACPTTARAVPTAQEYADGGAADRPRVGPADRPRAGPPDRRAGRRAADARGGRQAAGRRRSCSSIMDAGMTELIRPMLYNAFHRIEPVVADRRRRRSCDVVGPLCESSDTLGKDRTLPRRRSASCTPSSTPAPTGRSWPPTTTAGCCRRK